MTGDMTNYTYTKLKMTNILYIRKGRGLIYPMHLSSVLRFGTGFNNKLARKSHVGFLLQARTRQSAKTVE